MPLYVLNRSLVSGNCFKIFYQKLTVSWLNPPHQKGSTSGILNIFGLNSIFLATACRVRLERYVNPSFTEPFGTHTFTNGGGGGAQADLPAISKTVAPMNVKFCRVLEKPLKVLEMLKLFT